MSERLDRIESMLSASVETGKRTDERLDRVSVKLESVSTKLESVAAQQEKNTSDIDTLVGAAATFASDCEALSRKIDESNQRFDTLRAENIADRAEYRRQNEETNARIEAERAEYQRQNAETNARIEAERAEYQRLNAETNARIEAERAEYRRQNESVQTRIDATLSRIDAQQEIMQRLLVELIQTNRDASQLRDRVDTLEQAS